MFSCQVQPFVQHWLVEQAHPAGEETDHSQHHLVCVGVDSVDCGDSARQKIKLCSHRMGSVGFGLFHKRTFRKRKKYTLFGPRDWVVWHEGGKEIDSTDTTENKIGTRGYIDTAATIGSLMGCKAS